MTDCARSDQNRQPETARAVALTLQRLIIASAAGAAELQVLAWLLETPVAFMAVLQVHGVVALCLLTWAHWYGKGRSTGTGTEAHHTHWLWLFAGSTALLGPLGAIPGLLTLVLRLVLNRRRPSFETWCAALFPTPAGAGSDPDAKALAARLAGHTADLAVLPFADILRHGEQADKHYVISLIARDFHPLFARALLQALNDDDSSVRIQAATAFGNLEKAFVRKVMSMAARGTDDPEASLLLARMYDDYAFSGLLDERRARELRVQALRMFGKWLQQRGFEDPEVAIAMGRLLVRAGRYRAAARWLERHGQRAAQSVAWLSWYLEALFRNADYGTLRQVIAMRRAAYATAPLPNELRAALSMWSP